MFGTGIKNKHFGNMKIKVIVYGWKENQDNRKTIILLEVRGKNGIQM